VIVDVATSQEVATLAGHDGPVTGVAYLPDEETIVTSSFDGSVRFWDARTGAERSFFDAGVGQVVSIAVSPDGARLLAGGDGGAVKLWAITNSNARLEATLAPGHQSFVMGVVFDDSGEVAASVGGEDGVRLWSVAPQGEVAAWTAGLPIAFTDDGSHIATTGADGSSIVIRRTSDWQPEATLADVASGEHPSVDRWGWIGGVAMTPAADRVVVVASEESDTAGSVSIWDTSTGKRLNTLLRDAYLKGAVDVSSDGRLVAVAVCNRPGPTAYVWDVETGETVFVSPKGDCGQAIDLDPSGRLLAVQSLEKGRNIEVWDIATGDEVLVAEHPPAWLGAVSFSPDGSKLLTGGSDGTIRIWDVATGDLVRVFTGHTGAVEDAGWSSDGSVVISGSHDRTARIWNASTGETLLILEGHETWPFTALVPEQKLVVTATPGLVRVWTLDVDELTGIARARVPRALSTAECLTYHFEECPPTR
jgi:WD40 repeat protein